MVDKTKHGGLHWNGKTVGTKKDIVICIYIISEMNEYSRILIGCWLLSIEGQVLYAVTTFCFYLFIT